MTVGDCNPVFAEFVVDQSKSLVAVVRISLRMAIGHGGWWCGASDIEAGKGELSQEAYRSDSVERNRYPHTAQFRKLQSDMNILDPKGWALGRYSFDSADVEGARIYPDLSA